MRVLLNHTDRLVWRSVFLMTVVAATILAQRHSTQTTNAAFPGYPGSIIFYTDREGGGLQPYLMNGDGTCQRPFSVAKPGIHHPGFSPAWSPDGSKIAFGGGSISVVNADGTGYKTITLDEGNRDPAWSPDGQKIAFVSERDGNPEIYVMNADGSNQINLTNDPLADQNPDWSPDGSLIVFESNRTSDPLAQPPFRTDIYVMEPNGSNVKRLTDTLNESEGEPDWSPDGSQIVFVEGLTGQIRVMNSDGTGVKTLTEGSAPFWSPDGTHIAFSRTAPPAGEFDVFVMEPDGSNQVNLTNGYIYGRNDMASAWQPLLAPITGIQIGKVVRGAPPNSDWAFTSEQLGNFTIPAEGGCAAFESLDPGTFVVTEQGVADYWQYIVCDNGQSGTNSISLQLAQDQLITCTSYSDVTPALTLFLDVYGAPPSTDWQITGDLGEFSMPAAGGQELLEDLSPGTYTFGVVPKDGYRTSINCSTSNLVTEDAYTIELHPGQIVECSIGIRKLGSVTLQVEVVGTPPSTDWQFEGDFFGPTIPAEGGMAQYGDLEDNSYRMWHDEVAGFSAESSCSSGETGTWEVSAYVTDGADVLCTFVFTRQAQAFVLLPVLLGSPTEDLQH